MVSQKQSSNLEGEIARPTTMNEHFHTDIVAFMTIGISALIFFNLWRFAAGQMAKQRGTIGSLGKSAGALVTFGS